LNTTFISFLLIHYIFKRWGNITYIYQKNHVDFKYVYLQIVLLIKEKKSSRYLCCSNVWNSEDSNAFSIKLFYILVFFYRCIDLGKTFRNEISLFSFGQSMKMIIMVKVGYFCVGQRMMWDNVVNLSHIFC